MGSAVAALPAQGMPVAMQRLPRHILNQFFMQQPRADAVARRGSVRAGKTPGVEGMRKVRRIVRFILLVLLIPLSGHAEVAKGSAPHRAPARPSPLVRRLGAADAWTAYTYNGHSGKVCYMTGFPAKREPAHIRRKPAVMMVTHRPEEHVTDVVSFAEGYPFKDGSDASLDIDGTKFDLFTKGDTAWSRTSDTDKAIVAAMAKGSHATITGTPQRGPALEDTYSLAGFTHALDLIDKACGVER
jgi:Invasion associated locus B (IalB) protein